jgi:tyrosinase
VQYIAVQAPDNLKQQWTDAANSFRIPFWDWGSGGGNTVPDIFTQELIQVTKASGNVELIPNPLYSYRFHPLIPEDFEGKVRMFIRFSG